ncbi:glutamate racemase [Vagococcus xieshaowenii]|uniref:Glutamate racemase n=1 Tax=Vagococcus xieshaowenii TaxID=2562451 RepID=A0AAJ5EGP1_9ENTE|nr:glutamate racemase [Vagococcus xieshaowenii]QCA28401.1 glutamate racemase [Vagococcus xieshaowenii]TFZ42843.1 glutamate racemase [Vagococcus xieshaowenii]
MATRAIGFIDSGVGGLTVVREALKQLPNETIMYLGDTARCPYGPRPAEQVVQFTWEMANFLVEKNIKMLVIACNTATAVALDEIKAALDIPVVGVILPGTRASLKQTKNNRIGMIATLGTVKSHSYLKAIHNKSPKTEVVELACPRFVPLVESKSYQTPLAKKVVAETLQPLMNQKIDTLILGCTHYPLLRPIIQNVIGHDVTLVDSGAETISDVSMLLDYFDIVAPVTNDTPQHEFYTTASTKMFEEIARDWLPLTDIHVQKISLGEEKRN